MSSAFRFVPTERSDWSESAGFMAVSLGLHIALALFFFLNQQPYGVKDGSTEISFTEVNLAVAHDGPQNVPAEPAPAAPAAPVAPPAQPAVPEEPVVMDETLPEPEPTAAKAEEPQPEPIPETTATPDAGPRQPDAGGMPMPRGSQTLFCTHPPINHGRGSNHAPASYGVLGSPPGNGQDGSGTERVMLLGQEGGPKIIRFFMPEYPYNARVQNLEGMVLLAIKLDESGAVQEISVMRSGGYEFDVAAVDAASRSQFGPAVVDGIPVACVTVLPIRFTLN